MDINKTYDVVVVGGGAAGLSAALVLGRSRRSVLVIDAGEPRNASAEHLHNHLGREGARPAELLTTGPTLQRMMPKVGGSAATPFGGALTSAADGVMAGTMLNHELAVEETAAAVAGQRKEVA